MKKYIELPDNFSKTLKKKFSEHSEDQFVDITLRNGEVLKDLLIFDGYKLITDELIILDDIKNVRLNSATRRRYSKQYNSTLSTIQIDKELHKELKSFLKDKMNIREFIEPLIKQNIK